MLRTIALAVLLGVTSWAAHPLGGLIAAVISLTPHIPYLGRVAGWILLAPVRLAGLVKLATWIIASSGMLLGLLAYRAIWGPPTRAADFWVLLVVAGASVVRMVDDLVFFKLVGPNEVADGTRDFAPRLFAQFADALRDSELRLSVFRATFVDMYLPRFFHMLVSIGIIYYALGHLHLLATADGKPPALSAALLTSLTLNGVLGSAPPVFQGAAWGWVQVASSFLVFYWLTIFISLVASTPERDHGEYRHPADDVEAMRRGIEEAIARASAPQGDAPLPDGASSTRADAPSSQASAPAGPPDPPITPSYAPTPPADAPPPPADAPSTPADVLTPPADAPTTPAAAPSAPADPPSGRRRSPAKRRTTSRADARRGTAHSGPTPLPHPPAPGEETP